MEHMPEDFDLSGASIGNLILTGGYLSKNNRDINTVLCVCTWQHNRCSRYTSNPGLRCVRSFQNAPRLACTEHC